MRLEALDRDTGELVPITKIEAGIAILAYYFGIKMHKYGKFFISTRTTKDIEESMPIVITDRVLIYGDV